MFVVISLPWGSENLNDPQSNTRSGWDSKQTCSLYIWLSDEVKVCSYPVGCLKINYLELSKKKRWICNTLHVHTNSTLCTALSWNSESSEWTWFCPFDGINTSNLGSHFENVNRVETFWCSRNSAVGEKHPFSELVLIGRTVFTTCSSFVPDDKWTQVMCIHSQPPTSLRQKMAFWKSAHFVQPRVVFIQALAGLLAFQMRESECRHGRSLSSCFFPQNRSV